MLNKYIFLPFHKTVLIRVVNPLFHLVLFLLLFSILSVTASNFFTSRNQYIEIKTGRTTWLFVTGL